MKKFLLIPFFCFVAAVLNSQQFNTVAACIEEGQAQFNRGDIQRAYNAYLVCYNLAPENTDILLSVGGLSLELDKLEDAKKYFTAAAGKLDAKSPYIAYTYSRLGDIYYKQKNLNAALSNYGKSLSYNASNVNSLIGRGVVMEEKGDLKRAARAYKAALMVEPYNIIARENYRRLEPEVLTDGEILQELKERKAVSEETQILTPTAKDLYLKIHRAEQSGAIDYLSTRYKDKVPASFVIEKNTGTPDLRLMLSNTGYDAFIRLYSMDANRDFQKAGVNPLTVYELRDRYGNPVFDKEKVLTEQGIGVYAALLKGKKYFILPTEKPIAQQRTESVEIQKLRAAKFTVEISNKEHSELLKRSRCTEETLRKEDLVRALPTKPIERIFIKQADGESNIYEISVYNIIMELRDGKRIQIAAENFFGYGAGKSKTICNDKGELDS